MIARGGVEHPTSTNLPQTVPDMVSFMVYFTLYSEGEVRKEVLR